MRSDEVDELKSDHIYPNDFPPDFLISTINNYLKHVASGYFTVTLKHASTSPRRATMS